MSNTAKIGIPTVGDNGKGIVYNEALDRWDVTDVLTQAEFATHESDTTSVHGITDTATLYRSGGTDVAVADGGTGSSTAGGARTNLGLGTISTYNFTISATAPVGPATNDLWLDIP